MSIPAQVARELGAMWGGAFIRGVQPIPISKNIKKEDNDEEIDIEEKPHIVEKKEHKKKQHKKGLRKESKKHKGKESTDGAIGFKYYGLAPKVNFI